ncbi:hypothetical protein [Caballeronia sordidicola]|uniref:hypothetical protein n=1 Tax=Caballeronia sordidicola TaxID=196367 RepID=UPI000B3398FB|nr:hypothetical protein [Caballeronia sordidicola]
MLTAAELKEIRAVLCEMAARGCVEVQLERAWKDLVAQYQALKAATAKPGAVAK